MNERQGSLVSVVMPTFNCADFIEESIRSIQDQTYAEWELVVVDDCSTDDTSALLAAAAASDPRVTVIRVPGWAGRPSICTVWAAARRPEVNHRSS